MKEKLSCLREKQEFIRYKFRQKIPLIYEFKNRGEQQQGVFPEGNCTLLCCGKIKVR